VRGIASRPPRSKASLHWQSGVMRRFVDLFALDRVRPKPRLAQEIFHCPALRVSGVLLQRVGSGRHTQTAAIGRARAICGRDTWPPRAGVACEPHRHQSQFRCWSFCWRQRALIEREWFVARLGEQGGVNMSVAPSLPSTVCPKREDADGHIIDKIYLFKDTDRNHWHVTAFLPVTRDPSAHWRGHFEHRRCSFSACRHREINQHSTSNAGKNATSSPPPIPLEPRRCNRRLEVRRSRFPYQIS